MTNATNLVERTFSEAELTALEEHKKAIITLQGEAEGIAATIAYHLWDINQKKLYEIETKANGEHFKGMGDYAQYTFDISKGTCSDSIAAFERFGNKETHAIDAKYSQFAFSNLMALKKATDTDIDAAGITSNDSRATIKDKLSKLEANKTKLAMLPDKRMEASNRLAQLEAYATDGTMLDTEKAKFIQEVLDRFGVTPDEIMLDSMDYDKVSEFLNVVNRHIDDCAQRISKGPSEEGTTDTEHESTTGTEQETVKPNNTLEVSAAVYAKIVKLINKETGAIHNAVGVSGDTLTLVVK